jgi:hypothetical protein
VWATALDKPKGFSRLTASVVSALKVLFLLMIVTGVVGLKLLH